MNEIMATSIKLSKITKDDLRDCWQNEATDFTPWLASDENIALLAEQSGLLSLRKYNPISFLYNLQGIDMIFRN